MSSRGRWHVFICHATEDKAEVATPLARILQSHGLQVWFDKFSLELGDNLRRSIEEGLSKSRYGIVIFSPSFFKKEWPKKELDALLLRETSSNRKVILPIWHNVTAEDMANHSTILANTVSVSTSEGIENVANEIIRIIGRRHKLKQHEVPRNEGLIDRNFQSSFSTILDRIVEMLEKNKDPEINDLIDKAIMLFKDRIEKWDAASVKFATNELFLKLYKYTEEDGLAELYVLFKDLFIYAHAQRKHLLGIMLEAIQSIMFKSWLDVYDIKKAEKASKVMLRLGMDFVDKDFEVVKSSMEIIDNLADDMFEPAILSKEILFAASLYAKSAENPIAKENVSKLLDWIRINADDSGSHWYLRDSIAYAEAEQGIYGLELDTFKKELLVPLLEQVINDEISNYVEFIDLEENEREDENISYETELLEEIILSYESIRPTIANEIKQKILDLKHQNTEKSFCRIIESSKILTKIYKGSDMVITLDELIRFLRINSARSESDVGLTTFGLLMIDFAKRLKEHEKKDLEQLGTKYLLDSDDLSYDVNDQSIHLEQDGLVFENRRYDIEKLITFLNEVNIISPISGVAVGIAFNFRQTS